MGLTSVITGGFPVTERRLWLVVTTRAGWRDREWRLGRHFGRRLARLPPPRPSPVPSHSLGTAARIERLRSRYAGKAPATDGQITDAVLTAVFRQWPT